MYINKNRLLLVWFKIRQAICFSDKSWGNLSTWVSAPQFQLLYLLKYKDMFFFIVQSEQKITEIILLFQKK